MAGLNAPTAKLIIRVVRDYLRRDFSRDTAKRRNVSRPLATITAKLTSKASGQSVYAWSQSRRTPTGWHEPINGRSGTTTKNAAYSLDESDPTDITGKHVVLARVPTENASGGVVGGWVIVGSAEGCKPVRLQNPAGDPGTLATVPALTYDVYEMDNTTLIASAVSMLGSPGGGVRIIRAPINPGTYGLLGSDASGNPKLIWADESYNSNTCSISTSSQSFLAFSF